MYSETYRGHLTRPLIMHTEAAPEDAQVSYGRITGNVFRPDVPNLKDYLNLDGIPDEWYRISMCFGYVENVLRNIIDG